MKVLMANKFFYLKGGAEKVFLDERLFLQNWGLEVVDFAMEHPKNRQSPYRDYFTPYFGIGDDSWINQRGKFARLADAVKFVSNFEAKKKIRALIKNKKPDIAHLHNIYHQLTPAVIPVLKKAGVKVVLTLHDYKLVCPVYSMLYNGRPCNRCNGRSFWKAAALRCKDGSSGKSLLLAAEAYWHRLRGSYGQVDVFISPSRFLARLVKNSGYGFSNLEVITNGIDTDQYRPNFNDRGYALFFGRLSSEKGLSTLLAAYKQFADSAKGGGGLRLKIVGDGPLLKPLRERFPEVEFAGYQAGDKLRDSIGNAAFVVVPSEWYENCSMSVLEAMAMGKPVIASDIGGLPEQVEDGKTGFLFQPGNSVELCQKMHILAQDYQMRKKLGKAARIKLEKEYSFKKHGQKLLELYSRLLTGESN